MDYLECNGQIFTGSLTGLLRQDIITGKKSQVPIKNDTFQHLIRIKKIEFYPHDSLHFFLVLNQKHIFLLSSVDNEITFSKMLYSSRLPILFLFSLQNQIFSITRFFIRNCSQKKNLKFRKKLDAYYSIIFSERSYTTLNPFSFFTMYLNWLIQKKLLVNLSPPIMQKRILLYLDLFHLDLIHWYKLIFEKIKSPFISYYMTREFKIVFLDGKKNVIVLNFYDNSINGIDFSGKVALLCNTPLHLFLVSVESYNGMWYLNFYKECSTTRKIIFYFFHEHYCPNLFEFKSILYYRGAFYFFYVSAERRLTHDLLFVETDKLYKSLYWSTITSFRLHEQYTELQNMLKEKQFKLRNLCPISENKTIPKCCVCMENNVNLFFIPCGHSCCCHECHSKIEQNKCPMCRETIKYHRIIFT